MRYILFIGLIGLSISLCAQEGTIKGRVKTKLNKSISGVEVKALGSDIAPAWTNERGEFELKLPGGHNWRIRFSHPTHDTVIIEQRVSAGFTYDRPVTMHDYRSLEQVDIIGQEITGFSKEEQMEILPVKPGESVKIPLATSIEKVVGLVTGGTSDEFSSQYRVRGGNFDENLVYVNGIEIYRPFLTRSGQQEGLGFTNQNMAEEVYFSTGGFGARFGDKMSSVLDIKYRKPTDFRATVEAGLLTTNIHLEGVMQRKKLRDLIDQGEKRSQPGRFTYLLGGRRYSTTYLLNSLETQGNYKPNFLDFQALLTYTPRQSQRLLRIKERRNGRLDSLYAAPQKLQLSAFIALSRNNYRFFPEARETTFGTIQKAFRLAVAFEGQEVSRYTTGQGALMLAHQPHARLKFNYTLSVFRTQEAELFEVEGGYRIGEVNTNFGSDEFGESDFDLGIGSTYDHGRNYLTADVLSGQWRGEWTASQSGRHKLYWGLKYVHQDIEDDLKEYHGVDSADYFVAQGGGFGLREYIRGQTRLTSQTAKAYLQHRWRLGQNLTLHTGLRGYYYDLTEELKWAPRIQLVYDASRRPGGAPLRLRLAAGAYHQPPFYREFRRMDGSLNMDIQSQTAFHLIGGMDYQFQGWGRAFRLFSEAYYKRMEHLIPYEAQNVRIRYYPDREALGYAYGLDVRLNGQFIKGVDSWVSLNILSTREDVLGDTRINDEGQEEPVGYLKRPTDQRVAFSMFFQDEMPINPTYKVHVLYVYGSGMRFGPPREFDKRTIFPFSAYHRVDLGFSKVFSMGGSLDKGLESIWATIEIFNLFQRSNTVSYLWIKDLENRQFAVPNNLSARLLNFRVIFKFR